MSLAEVTAGLLPWRLLGVQVGGGQGGTGYHRAPGTPISKHTACTSTHPQVSSIILNLQTDPFSKFQLDNLALLRRPLPSLQRDRQFSQRY